MNSSSVASPSSGDMASMKAKISVLRKEYKKLSKFSADQTNKIRELESELQDLSSSTVDDTSSGSLNEKDSRILILEGENSSLKEQLRLARAEVDAVKLALEKNVVNEQLQPERIDSEVQCEIESSLDAQLKSYVTKNDELEGKCSMLERDWAALNQKLERMQRERQKEVAEVTEPESTKEEPSSSIFVRNQTISRDLTAAACQSHDDPGSLLHICGPLADVKFKTANVSGSGEQSISAHKFLLLARCARFRDPGFVSKNEHMNFDGLSAETIAGVIEYCYTDRLISDISAAGLRELLRAASTLGLPRLRELCEQRLAASVTPETAAEMFAFADPQQAPQLRGFCQQYMLTHFGEMAKSGALSRLDAREAAALLTAHTHAPLHTAVELGRRDVVRRLLQRGLDVNKPWSAPDAGEGAKAKTPLEIALGAGHLDIAQELVAANCDTGTPVDSTSGDSLLHVMARRSDEIGLKGVKFLLEGGLNVNVTNREGATPLHEAVLHENLELIKLLTSTHASVDSRDAEGRTPLYIALWNNNMNAAEFLCENGADVSALVGRHVSKNQIWGNTLIHAACNEQLPEVVNFLVNHDADILARNAAKETCLHLCCSDENHLPCLEVILGDTSPVPREKLHDAVIGQDSAGCTCLHIAARAGLLKPVNIVMKHMIVESVDILDEKGRTALQYALWAGHKEVAKRLANFGANIMPLMHLACQDGLPYFYIHLDSSLILDLGNIKVIEFLVEQGANVNAPNRSGQSPLHLASWMGHVDVAMLLLNSGADAMQRDDGLLTTLHTSAMHPDLSLMLVQLGVPVDATDAEGNTPLHTAAESSATRTAQILIDNGAAPSVQNVRGETPLHKACMSNDSADLVRLLLDSGVSPNVKTIDGITPLHVATRAGNNLIIPILMASGADPNSADNSGVSPLGLYDGNIVASASADKALKSHVLILEGITAEPRWQDDKDVMNCPICVAQFNVTIRRHHCRHCGRVVCGKCSPNHRAVSSFGIERPVRVCVECDSVLDKKMDDSQKPVQRNRSIFRRRKSGEKKPKSKLSK